MESYGTRQLSPETQAASGGIVADHQNEMKFTELKGLPEDIGNFTEVAPRDERDSFVSNLAQAIKEGVLDLVVYHTRIDWVIEAADRFPVDDYSVSILRSSVNLENHPGNHFGTFLFRRKCGN